MSEPLNVPIATIKKNGREEIRVALAEFKGTKFVDVRVYAEFAGATHARSPTKEGVAIAFDRLPEVINALIAADTAARELGLLAKGGVEAR